MDDELLMVRVAELTYDQGKSQAEVGALLKISRWKVGRLLARAREEGIVRIEIVHPRARLLSLERELSARFGLAGAAIVPVSEDSESTLERVAVAAADLLAAIRPTPRVLGVSWGRTLAAVAEALPEDWATGISVVQLNGGVSLNRRSGGAASVAMTIAQRGGGQATLLPSPAILERVETKEAIESDRTVAGILDAAARAQVLLFSAGPCDHSSAHIENGYLSPDDIDELSRRGAVGDVLGRYIDADGNIVDPQLDARTVGVGLDRLREATTPSIFVTMGGAKYDIARTVVTSGLCSVLVTDEMTARVLLEEK
ncbi:sugar-binding transcriptional regulator [Microbacterium sp. NIBRBAC000506063]|uniref:sugar-binding transcriptional regulator n=1 Tax=Microbacterium sp. NIBRBAC000506063 TaxID=2734618 RepID=UPI001BB5D575|nr:sugar-binding domain-containing protein [Microbacterium sp. NIBRBAC000506063]QTV79543.1 sugar-binding transcriptional regulator [Microbacterium sp. NIBRBAC000506063]